MAQLFNSRDQKHKSTYGAVQAGQTFVFRLQLPDSAGAVIYSARLLMQKDGQAHVKSYPFEKLTAEKGTFEAQSDEGMAWWECRYTAEEPGLYWYSFILDKPDGEEHLYRGAYGNARSGGDPACWQLTVYEKGYTTPDCLKGATLYQIFPDRFYCSGNPKADVPADRELRPWNSTPKWRPNEHGEVTNQDYLGGDLKGIQKKLPYLKELGISILYLNPIFEAHSNHRYNTADYQKVDPLLGTEEDFVSLCQSAHKLDMKIILDGVFNHTGDDSIYFNRKGRYPIPGAYNSKNSPFYDWFCFEQWPDKYDSWWGFQTLPAVNESNPDYIDFITGKDGIIAKWLTLGADGWRLDVADELPDDFIRKIHERAKATKPETIILGEVWEDASNKIAYSSRRQYLLGHELDSVMNYPFAEAVIDFVRNNNAEDFLERILTITENYPKPVTDLLMNLLGTHDTVRILTRLVGESCEGKDREWQSVQSLSQEQYEHGIRLEKIAASLQFTLPGIPSLYYGDEAGMQGYKDPFNRKGFPWEHIRSDLHDWYAWLASLRKHCPVLKKGQFVPISGASGCVCYARIDETHPDIVAEKDALVVIANNNSEEITYHLPSELSDLTVIQNVSSFSGNSAIIPPYTCAFLGRGHWIDSLETIQ